MFLFLNRAFYEMMEALNPTKNKDMAKNTHTHARANVPTRGPVIPQQHNNTTNVHHGVNTVVKKKIKKEKIFVSKVPLLESTQQHILIPSKKDDIKIGSLVWVKTKGKFVQHKIAATDFKKGYKITRKGHSNGWTKHVFSKVENTKTVEQETPVSTL